MNTKPWTRYLELMAQRPEEFRNSGTIHIVTDPAIVRAYQEKTGTVIGVCYESPYTILVVDLVYEQEGEYFAYERLLSTEPQGAVVCVPKYGEKYLLLRQYRHAMRAFQYAFPRGYATAGLTGEENARKELREELGAQVSSVKRLGSVVADSGISGTEVDIYLCAVESYDNQPGHEGIVDTIAVSAEELAKMIAGGQITDGFTLSACSYLTSKRQ